MRSISIAVGCLAAASLSSLIAASNNPVPFVNQPTIPGSARVGSAAFTLTLRGDGFVGGARHSMVNWNGLPLKTNVVNALKIEAEVPSNLLTKETTAAIMVVNAQPGGGPSNPVYFNVTNRPHSVRIDRSVELPSGHLGVTSIASADFNHDGNLDLVALQGQNAYTFLGNGDGTFQPFLTSPVQAGLFAGIAVADFNGDGKPDLATTSSGLEISFGNGDGTFQSSIEYPLNGAALDVVAGDFNQDGNLDLAVTEFYQTVQIFLGNGSGTFVYGATVSVGNYPEHISVIDFNHDGNLDLAVTNTDSESLSILIGKGDGTFAGQVVYALPGPPRSLVTADLNGDRIPDVAVVCPGTVSVFLGKGDGTFGAPLNTVLKDGRIDNLAAGDFDGSGVVSLIVSDFDAQVVYFGRNAGAGTFVFNRIFNASRNGITGLAVGDFDLDGRLDLAFANDTDPTVVTVMFQKTPGKE